MKFKKIGLFALYISAQVAPNFVVAQVPSAALPKAVNTAPAARETTSINGWLLRLHEASKRRNYVGTYVVSSGGQMQSAKIWHVCEGSQQMERVENLTGAPRSTFRHNEKVVTFMPEQKVVRTEKREPTGNFPELVQSADNQIARFYKIKPEGVERIAGLESDVVQLVPKDNLRFGYRVWTEQKKGLVVQLQTLDANGRVLEQAAFSELQFDVPVQMDKLLQMMDKVDGYRVEESALVKTSASAEGWQLMTPVAGFMPMSCFKRPTSSGQLPDDPMQWVFSDGLASVSLFVEPFDRQKNRQESAMTMGATHTITHRLGDYWITAMGEVPMGTLKQFVSGLERKK
jgi:sigma-E factor negative regulatory protein RseB